MQPVIDNTINCSICYDSIIPVQMQPDGKYTIEEETSDIVCSKACYHFFHKVCIQPWAEAHDLCPNCNGPDLKRNLVHFNDFSKKYLHYLNDEIQKKDLIPPEDAPRIYPNLEAPAAPLLFPDHPLSDDELRDLVVQRFEPHLAIHLHSPLHFELPPIHFEPPRLEIPPIHVHYYRQEQENRENPFVLIPLTIEGLKKISTSYATLQLAIACFQLLPTKWAQRLYSVQKGMLAFDACVIAGQLGTLYDKNQLLNKWVFITSLLIYLYIAKHYIFKQPNDPFSPLPTHLQKGLSIEEASQFQMHTYTPRLFQTAKWLIGTKLFLHSATLPVSRDQPAFWRIFVIQFLALAILFSRKWVSFKRMLESPLKEIPYIGNDQLKSLKTATVELHILQPFGSTNFTSPELVKTLYDYTSEFFRDSKWYATRIKDNSPSFYASIPSRPILFQGKDLFPLTHFEGAITGSLHFSQGLNIFATGSTWEGTASLSLTFMQS